MSPFEFTEGPVVVTLGRLSLAESGPRRVTVTGPPGPPPQSDEFHPSFCRGSGKSLFRVP